MCQIDGAPACADTSTTTYWSYWYRAKGSRSWVYASEGSGSHDPAPGSTEAWVWQDGRQRTPPDVAQRTICPVATTCPGARSSPEPGTAKTSHAKDVHAEGLDADVLQRRDRLVTA